MTDRLQNPTHCGRTRQRSARLGAILSYELMLVLPIVLALVVALVEFGLLWSASHKVQLAAQVACRVGTRPCDRVLAQDEAVRLAAERALIDRRLVASHRLTFRPATRTGEPVSVEIKVPMGAASPDMLALFGYSLKNRFLVSRVVMSKE